MNTTRAFGTWYGTLDESTRNAVIAAVEMLADAGPVLGRPLVDRINGSKHHNMKELRPRNAARNCRILFIFDPRRQIILLLGGDKTGQWRSWYQTSIPQAERLYDTYLEDLRTEGSI